MFRSSGPDVSAVSGFVSKGYTRALHHVSCSPSKIPYGGFSPVRLKAGIRLRPSRPGRRLKCEAHMHRIPYHLYATKAEVSGSSIAPDRGQWETTPSRALLPRRSSPEALGSPVRYVVAPGHRLLFPHVRLSAPPDALLFFVHRVFALRPRMGWEGEVPQFAPRTFRTVPSSVPRRSSRVPLVVSSPTVIAFANFAVARQPQVHTRRFPRGRVTGLQSSRHGTARCVACPSPARTFTTELSAGRVAPVHRRL